MANAIKHISVERGYDVTEYTLCCFGGAGGQHACLVADALGMTRVLLHPFAGVLSAYGMGLADVRSLKQRAVEAILSPGSLTDTDAAFDLLEQAAKEDVAAQGIPVSRIVTKRTLHLKYEGTDTTLETGVADLDGIVAEFARRYRQQYGFHARQAAGDRGGRRGGGRSFAGCAGVRTVAFAPRDGPLRPLATNRSTRKGAITTRRSSIAGPAARRHDRGARGDPRGYRDHRRRAGLARDVHQARRSRPRASVEAACRDHAAGTTAIQCCSKCSTTLHGDRRADGRDARQHGLFRHMATPDSPARSSMLPAI
jgi:hypothetical protein